MRKIVIVKGSYGYSDYNDASFIVKHTEPMEVSEEDFVILTKYLRSLTTTFGCSYHMLEYVPEAEVVDVLAECRKQKAVDDEYERSRKEKAAKQWAAAEDQSRLSKLKQFEKLKKELGVK